MQVFDRALQYIIDHGGDDLLYDSTIAEVEGFGDTSSYRLAEVAISSETIITYDLAMLRDSYYITIEEYISTTGVRSDSGWLITNKTPYGFTFTPPSRYPIGTLTYKIQYYK